jgi:hypothetical protein
VVSPSGASDNDLQKKSNLATIFNASQVFIDTFFYLTLAH